MNFKDDPQDLLANHLAFLAAYRAQVVPTPDSIRIESDNADFNYGIVCDSTPPDTVTAILERFSTVHLLGRSERIQTALDAQFQMTAGLSYMSLGTHSPWTTSDQVQIDDVLTEEDVHTFTDVQSRSFIPDPVMREKWHPWLLSGNLRNHGKPGITPFIGRVGGRPAAVLLLLTADQTAGIYAVATLPESRKTGLGTTLLAHAVAVAARENRIVTLQVFVGSYAEKLYTHLGFNEAFRAQIFTRK